MARKKSDGAADEVRELFATPPKQFTAARTALAKKLSGAEAARVKKLRRPTSAAWLVNALSQRYGADVRALLKTSDALAKAQKSGRTSELHELSDELQSLVTSLTERAEELADEGGVKFTTALREKVETTLRSSAVDPESREKLESGTLERELEATGFGAFMSGPLPSAPKGRAREKAAVKKLSAKQVHAAERDAKAAIRELQKAQKQEREVRQQAERVQAELALVQAQLERAQEHAREANNRLSEARAQAD